VFALVAQLAVVATVATPTFSKGIDDQTATRWGQAGGVGYLIRAAWTEGEAAERGLTVSEADASEAAAEPHDGLTSAQDLRYEARINLLNAALKAPAEQAAAQSVTQEQIDAFVQLHPLTTTGERRVRLAVAPNPARAKAIERVLRRGVTWDRATDRYGARGPGLLTYPGPPRGRLEKAIFRASKNRITRYGRYVFKVTSEIKAGPLPQDQQRATAWEILAGDAQSRATQEFDAAMQAKWRPRTMCADPARAPTLCGNSPTV
jgi:hypothetical protein